jgi:hypothetical protein
MAVKQLRPKTDTLPELGNPTVIPLTDDQLNSLAGTYGGDNDFEHCLASAAKNQFVQTWTGCVVATGEHNHYDDSDFYAIVWDEQAGAPREVEYGTTRGWTYWNSAAVDATDEIKAKYQAWLAKQRAAARKAAARKAAMTPDKGKTVEVTGGRKLPKGAQVVVFWYGEDARRSNRWVTYYRVGVKTADGAKEFLAAEHVQVLNPTYLDDDGRRHDAKTGRYVKAA